MKAAVAAQEKPLVLVADDSRLIRKTIIKMLGDRFDIIECVDGVAAWAQIQHNGMLADYSWKRSAQGYQQLYDWALAKMQH